MKLCEHLVMLVLQSTRTKCWLVPEQFSPNVLDHASHLGRYSHLWWYSITLLVIFVAIPWLFAFKVCIIRIMYRHWQFFRHSGNKGLRISVSLVIRVVIFCAYRVVVAMYVHLAPILLILIVLPSWSSKTSNTSWAIILILLLVRMGWLLLSEPGSWTAPITVRAWPISPHLTLSLFGPTCCKPRVRFHPHPSVVLVHVFIPYPS